MRFEWHLNLIIHVGRDRYLHIAKTDCLSLGRPDIFFHGIIVHKSMEFLHQYFIIFNLTSTCVCETWDLGGREEGWSSKYHM